MSQDEEGPWAFLGGDVCPDCQTDEERRAVLHDAVAAVEGEGERRDRDELAPSPVEAPLTNWALEAREALDDGAVHYKVALTAAFFTDTPIDVSLEGRRDLYRKLEAECIKRPEWEASTPDGPTFEFGGGFKEPLPLLAAQRRGTLLLEDLRRRLKPPAPDLALEPFEVEIDVYDLGVAVLVAWFHVTAADVASSIAAIRRHTDLRVRGPLVAALRGLADSTVSQYRDLIEQVQQPTLRSWLSTHVKDEPGRLLWLHAVHVLPARPATLEPLLPDRAAALERDGGVFAPGIGWSILAGTDAPNALKLTKLHWAYYALYMEMDRGLLASLDSVRRDERRASEAELDADARIAFAAYRRAMVARTRLDTELSSLGGDELEIWETIADVQGFQPIVDGVERKLEVLQRLTERHVDLAEAARTRRVRGVLETLSALALLTLVVAAATFVAGGTTPTDADVWRVAVVVIAALAIVALVFRLRGSEATLRAARRRHASRASSGRPPDGPATS